MEVGKLSVPNFSRSKPDGLLKGTRGKSTSSTGDSMASKGNSPTATSVSISVGREGVVYPLKSCCSPNISPIFVK